MLKDNISPEEKLLKLIRADNKAKSSGAGDSGNFSEKKIEPAQSDLKRAKMNFIQVFSRKYFTHDLRKKLIYSSVFISMFYLIAVFIYPLVGLNKIDLTAGSVTERPETSPLAKKESQPYEFYLNSIQAHPLFGNLSGQQGEGIPSAIATQASSINDINLVGVIMGDNPQAIIEDKKAQKTYYLIKGQFIGDFQVEEIISGKVILNYHGQKFELNV